MVRSSHATDDAVARYCEATEANDIDAVTATLAPDPELVSPISGWLALFAAPLGPKVGRPPGVVRRALRG